MSVDEIQLVYEVDRSIALRMFHDCQRSKRSSVVDGLDGGVSRSRSPPARQGGAVGGGSVSRDIFFDALKVISSARNSGVMPDPMKWWSSICLHLGPNLGTG